MISGEIQMTGHDHSCLFGTGYIFETIGPVITVTTLRALHDQTETPAANKRLGNSGRRRERRRLLCRKGDAGQKKRIVCNFRCVMLYPRYRSFRQNIFS